MSRDATTFLTRPEVQRLTGRAYAPAQKRVLKSAGIRFAEDDFGRPVVMRAAVEQKLLGRAVTHEPGNEPDFSVFPRVS